MSYKTLADAQKWIIKGIFILFVIGTFAHFLYDLTGDCKIMGLFVPINESVWEHCKMVLWPIILYWSLFYLIKGKKYEIDKNKWFTGAIISLVVALISIPMLYYFYTQAFGTEILLVDVLILLAAIILGQLLGLHFYNHAKGINYRIVFAIFAILVIVFIIFTFIPPHIPLFMDGPTGNFGIAP